jgi:tRNA pseudouridine13 synthase
MRQFWVSAFQSAIFNRTLDRRLDDGLLAMLEIGDVAYKHQGHGQFLVTPEIAAAEDLSVRVSGFEISPSGPMLGKGMIQATGAVAERERDAAAEIAPDAPLLLAEGSAVEGTRRPFRVRVTNVEIDAGLDEHGNYLRLAFDLPRGAYATVLLRELMGDTDAVGEEGE